MHKHGRLYLTLILPDQSRFHIPAAWTDLTPVSAGPAAAPLATLGSLDELLRARAIVDALKRNLPPPTEPAAELAQEIARAAIAAVSELPRPPRTGDLPVGSTSQVENSRESTARQYALVNRAGELGCPPEQLTVIDEDLGISGASAANRSGFTRMISEVALGRVDIVLGLEVSRLARNIAGPKYTIDADSQLL
jgi:hypothetical protein